MIINVKIFKLFSIFLSYPNKGLKEILDNSSLFLNTEKMFSNKLKNKLLSLIHYFKSNDILYLQENYINIFDIQKGFSLYFFEHLHGDSKDRGQAMVDLKKVYFDYGLIIKKEELPDYIPLFLEYLSLLSYKESIKLLGETINIIAVIGRRLEKKKSLYANIFFALEELSNIKYDVKIVEDALILPKQSTNLDDDWNEPPAFGGSK